MCLVFVVQRGYTSESLDPRLRGASLWSVTNEVTTVSCVDLYRETPFNNAMRVIYNLIDFVISSGCSVSRSQIR